MDGRALVDQDVWNNSQQWSDGLPAAGYGNNDPNVHQPYMMFDGKKEWNSDAGYIPTPGTIGTWTPPGGPIPFTSLEVYYIEWNAEDAPTIQIDGSSSPINNVDGITGNSLRRASYSNGTLTVSYTHLTLPTKA